MEKGSKTHYSLISVTSAFLVTSLFLSAFHNTTLCTYMINEGDSHRCAGNINIKCSGPAVGIDITGYSLNPKVDIDVICAWKERTLVLNYLATLFGLILLAFFSIKPQTRFFNLFIFLSALSFIVVSCLIGTLILMVSDILEGNNSLSVYKSLPGNAELSQRTYIINASLDLSALLLITILSIGELRSLKMKAKNSKSLLYNEIIEQRY